MGTPALRPFLRLATIDWGTIAIAASFVIPVFLVAPLRVFALNTSEFPVGLADVVRGLVVVSLLLLLLCYILGRVWPRAVLPALVALALIASFESALFLPLAAHRAFDGRPIDWSQWRLLSAVEIGAAIAVCLAAYALRRRPQIQLAAAVSILLLHGLGLGSTLIEQREAIEIHEARHDYSYFAGFHRLSATRNVVHVVSDTTQGAMVEELIARGRGRYEQVFDGFTIYRQAMGRYPGTYPSVPFYMTGHALEPEGDSVVSQPFTAKYITQTLWEHSIVGTLASRGFRAYGYQCCALYCAGHYRACAVGDVFDGRGLELDHTGSAVRRLLDVALFQTTPLVVRERIHADGEWLLRAAHRTTRTYSAVMDAFVSSASADGPANSYNYFHLAGAHVPLQFDEHCTYVGVQPVTPENQRRQVTCALRQVERLIDTLKRLDVYDQTLIVFHGDHGTPGLPSSMAPAAAGAEFLIGTASALVMIKPMKARGPLRVSTAPASLGDIPATIADGLGLDARFPGYSLLRLDGAERERQFLTYDDSDKVAGVQALLNLRRYRVRGNLFDRDSWVGPAGSESRPTPSALWMDDEQFDRHATGFGGLERQVKPARWVTSARARVSLAFPVAGPASLVLESYVPPSIPGQTVTVAINGRVIATLDKTAMSGLRHVIPIPDDLSRRPVNTIDLTPARTVTVAGDGRQLSMVLAYIGLEPAR
jgi:hypothetical protein